MSLIKQNRKKRKRKLCSDAMGKPHKRGLIDKRSGKQKSEDEKTLDAIETFAQEVAEIAEDDNMMFDPDTDWEDYMKEVI